MSDVLTGMATFLLGTKGGAALPPGPADVVKEGRFLARIRGEATHELRRCPPACTEADAVAEELAS